MLTGHFENTALCYPTVLTQYPHGMENVEKYGIQNCFFQGMEFVGFYFKVRNLLNLFDNLSDAL